jgi:hypothetical protein
MRKILLLSVLALTACVDTAIPNMFREAERLCESHGGLVKLTKTQMHFSPNWFAEDKKLHMSFSATCMDDTEIGYAGEPS